LLQYLQKTFTAEHNGVIGHQANGVGGTKRNGEINGCQKNINKDF
jgi:hypothetical protein